MKTWLGIAFSIARPFTAGECGERSILERVLKAPTGRSVTARGNALGCGARNDSSPEGAQCRMGIPPFQGLGPQPPMTQGVALGYRITPRWGFKRNIQNALFARFTGPARGVRHKPLAGICTLLVALVAPTFFTVAAQRSVDGAQRLPVIYWAQGIETAASLKQAGLEQIAAPPDKAEEWRGAGFNVLALSQQELEQREKLLVPRTAGRADVASATRRPWIDANGWRFVRKPAGKFYYDLTEKGAGRAALAAAEAFAYRADAVLKIDPNDLASFGKMLAFLRALPPANLPPVADIGLIDDGSETTGEVMNLLVRRNLLFKILPAPAPQYRVNITLGSKEYPLAEASDPNAFALKIRHQLGDENRSLRIYGTEVAISRFASDGARARLDLLNYSGRNVDSLRVRLRGKYGKGELKLFGIEQARFEDYVVADGATEFTIPKLGVYAWVELPVTK